MITVEACRDLGTIEGTEFAGRQIRATIDAFRSAEPEARDAAITVTAAEWTQRQLDERSRRRMELALIGAGLAGLAAYEEARELAFGLMMRTAAADLAAIEATKPNRKARRRAAKAGEPLQ